MKKIKIVNVRYDIVRHSTSSKRIVGVNFHFTYKGFENKLFSVKLDCYRPFKFKVPFSDIRIHIPNGTSDGYSIEEQIFQYNLICKGCTGQIVEVGTYDDKLIDISVEKELMRDINSVDSNSINSSFSTSDKFNEWQDKDFIKNLIEYYKLSEKDNTITFEQIEIANNVNKYNL